MPKSAPRNFIYPLNPKSKQKYTFDNRGEFKTSLENFFNFEVRDYSTLSEWGITTNFRVNGIHERDLIWVHFVLPIGEIRAVGRVAKSPYWRDDWESWAIKIRWDKKLTTALQVRPIHLNQRNLRGASTPSAPSEKIIERWLQSKSTVKEKRITKAVAFDMRMMKQRRGQKQFRDRLMRAYSQTCAMTGCQVLEALQGAHIQGVTNRGNHSVNNGLILRADIHNLFDIGLITVSDSYRILVSDLITDKKYRLLDNKLLGIPKSRDQWPSKNAFALHRTVSLLKTAER